MAIQVNKVKEQNKIVHSIRTFFQQQQQQQKRTNDLMALEKPAF